MAICRADYEIFRRLRERGLIRPGGSLLEIGEAEFYGDVAAQQVLRDFKEYGSQPQFLGAVDLIGLIRRRANGTAAWSMSKLLYEVFLGVNHVESIDLHGTDDAHKLDLNYAIADERYDIVYNTGTAEHVFHVGRVLEFVHESCKLGGLMVHCFPLAGLMDHGFWTVNPCLAFCLARANLYEMLDITVSQIEGTFIRLEPATARQKIREMVRTDTLPRNSWLHVAFRRASDAGFIIPTQEIYSACPEPEIVEAWREFR